MKFFRVKCPNCRRLYPVPVTEQAFTCPRCRYPVRLVPSLEGTGWVADVYRELAEVQVVHPLNELIAGNAYRAGGRAVGAARARRMLRHQRSRRRGLLRLSPLPMILLCAVIAFLGSNTSLTNWLPDLAIPREFFAALNLLAEPAVAAPDREILATPTATLEIVALPVSSSAAPTALPTLTATPLPPPTLTATPLPPDLIQATAWQATVEAALATSYAKQTQHSSRQEVTEAAISARQTEWAGIRLGTPTP